MKKIFTLILLATLSLVVVAQPSATLQPSKAQAMKSFFEKERMSNTLQSLQSPVRHENKLVAGESVQWSGNVPYEAVKSPSQAPAKALLDTLEVEFDSFYEDPYFYPADTIEGRNGTIITPAEWYFVLRNDRYQFIFDIINNTNPETMAGTYTEADLEEWYSWCMFPEANGKTHYYKTCDLTIQEEKLSANLIKYTVDAVVLATKGIGGEEYGYFKVHAEHKVVVAKSKWDVAILDCAVTPEDDRFRIVGKNDTMDVDLTFFTETGVEGYYTHKLLDEENSKFAHRGKSHGIMELEGIITSAENIYGGVSYVFMYEAFTTDTSFYNVAMEAPVVATDTIEFSCNNAILDDTYGASDATITITASNAEYSILAGYNDTKITSPAVYPTGSSLVYLDDLKAGKTINSMQSTISINGNDEDGYQIEIEMLGYDHKYYIIHLTYGIPEVQRTVTLDFPNSSKSMYYIDDLGLKELQLVNYNGDYSVSFDILYIDQVMGGEFTRMDLWEEQTFITHHTEINGEPFDAQVVIAEIGGKVWQAKDTTFLTATVLGFDSVQYEISMFYTVPTPTEVVDVTFNKEDVLFTNALPQGIFILEGMSEDGNIMATIQVNRIEGEKLEDIFINDGKFDENDFDAANTVIKVWNDELEDFVTLYPQKGEMTVTVDDNKQMLAVAKFICDDAKQYNLTIHSEYVRVRLPYDSEEPPVDYTFDPTSYVETEDFLAGYGMVYLGIRAHDYSAIASFYLYADHYDLEIGVPEGTYHINKSGEVGSAFQSTGIGMDGHPIEAFFCWMIYNEEENAMYYDTDGLYCLVEGTITITKVEGRLKVEVDAINSYEQSVKLHYEASGTGVNDVEINQEIGAEKYLKQGQLIIKRNGKTYNVLGANIQ